MAEIRAGTGVGAIGGFMVAAGGIKANTGVIQVLGVECADIVVSLAADVRHVADGDD